MAPATREKEEDALPIDIVYTKLLDWLLERKKVSPKWHDSLRNIRLQIDQALGELQAGDESAQLSTWLQGKDLSQIHYYNCRRIMDILLSTQSGRVKNIFGQYKNTLLGQWSAILKAYEKENIYLGEASRLLQQQTHYCTHTLRKRISDGENEVMECEQGVLECGKKVKHLQKKFVQVCEELLGVSVDVNAFFSSENEKEGKDKSSPAIDFHASLLGALVRELPPLFEKVENLLKEDVIGEALIYHLEMRQFLHSYGEGKEKDVGGEGEGGGEETFPMLCKVRRGERLVVVDTGLSAQEGGREEGEGEEEGEIDWGDDAGGEGGEQETQQEIDWDIAVVDNDTAAAAPSSFPPSASKPPSTAAAAIRTTDTTAQNTDSLLADPTCRTHLLNDLLELEAFLRHRRLELSDEATNNAFTGQYQGQHAALQQQSLRTIERYLDAVTHTLTKLRAKRLQQLLAMRASSVYVDRLVSGFEQRLLHIEKLQRTIKHTQARREEALASLGKARPEYEATTAAIKSLKQQVETSMSDLFKGRKVHIIGEINTL